MIKVAFNINPLSSAHKTRGIGTYTRNLLDELREIPELEIQEFKHGSEVKDAEVIHFPWFDLYYQTLPLIKKVPTIVTVHDVIPLIFKDQYPIGIKAKIAFGLQKLALRGCKYVITVSKQSKLDIIKYLRMPEQKIIVVPNAKDKIFKVLPDSEILRVKRQFRLPDNFLLYVGDANYSKNLPFLLKAFKKLKRDSTFQNLKLVLVGTVFLKKLEGNTHPELNSLAETLDLINSFSEGEIIKTGQISTQDLIAYYNLAVAYIQPSLYEGFGLPVLEAMSCGTPVICSNISSLKEVAGSAGIYFDPNSIDQFIEVTKEVIQSKNLQQKLARMSIQRAENFSWEKVARDTFDVYQKAARP